MATLRNPYDYSSPDEYQVSDTTNGVMPAPSPVKMDTPGYTPDQIGGWYQQYLGRGLSNPGEAIGWLSDPNAEQDIKNSAEGQAYAKQPPTSSYQPVTPPVPLNTGASNPYASVNGYDFGKLQDTTHNSAKYNPDVRLFSQALAANPGALPNDAGMTSIVNWINAHGGTASGNQDMLTINGTPIDVIGKYHGGDPSQATWEFQDPRASGGAAAPSGDAASNGGGTGLNYGVDGWPSFGTGTNDFSGQIQDYYSKLMDNNDQTLNNPMSSPQFEAIRQNIDKARRAATNQYSAELANRGMLQGSGELANATSLLEQQIAPDFASAVGNASVQNANNARTNQTQTLGGATNFESFLAYYGLDRAKALDAIQSGHYTQLLQAYQTYLNGVGIASNGYI